MVRAFVVVGNKVEDCVSYMENIVNFMEKVSSLSIRLKIVYEGSIYAIGYVYVPSLHSNLYPIFFKDYEDKYIIFEGYVYNVDTESFISNVLSISNDHRKLSEYLRYIDGEYSLLVFDNSRRLLTILVDRYSTLGYYYTTNGSSLIVSRLPALCFPIVRGSEVSRVWLVESLKFGYPCTYEFIFRNVYRTLPASLTRIDVNNHTVERVQWCSSYDVFNSIYNVSKLSNYLIESCINRIRLLTKIRNIRKIVASLSGGLDSRIVTAAIVKALDMSKLDVKIEAETHKLTTTDSEEVDIALKVTEILGIDHNIRIVRKRVYSGRELYDNHVRFFLKLPQSMESKSDIVEAYGTGGDKILKPLGRLKEEVPRDPDNARSWICNRYGSLNMYEIARILNIDSESISEILYSTLRKYPEKDGRGILLRYLVEARLCNWLISDLYTWNTWRLDLHLSMPYFEDALHLDPRYKDYFRLCKDLLDELDRRLSKIKYYNIGCPLSEPLRLRVTISFLLRAAKKLIRGQRGSTIPSPELREILELKTSYFEDFIERSTNIIGISREKFGNILRKFIERAERSTLDYMKADTILNTFAELGLYTMLLDLARR